MSKEKEKEILHQLRERLWAKAKVNLSPGLNLEEKKLRNDKFLERFLRSNKWNVDKTEKMLGFYVQLNNELREDLERPMKDYPEEIQELFSCARFGSGCDYDGRPVLMIPDLSGVDFPGFLNRVWEREKNTRDPEDRGQNTMKLLSACYMKYHMKMEELVLDRNVDYGVVIINLSGVKYLHYVHQKTIEFFQHHFKLIESHSPLITGKVILINAPKIVKGIVTLVQKLVTFRYNVVIFGSDETNWKERLKDHVPLASLCSEFGGTLTRFEDM